MQNTPTISPKRIGIISLLIFTAISWAVYWKTRNAGFVTDWFGWEYKYRAGSWRDVIHSFGYSGLHPVLHFFNYTMYSLFEKSGMAWFLVFATIHAFNAWQAGRLYNRLVGDRGIQQWNGLTIALLVLLSPYAAEPVVWRVCLHYLIVLAFSLNALHKTLDYLETKSSKNLISIHAYFVLSLFSLEWALVLPGLIGVLIAWYQLRSRRFEISAWLKITVVQAGVIATWFALNKWILGKYIGHYGASTHLKFDLFPLLSSLWKYFTKHLLFLRYWKHPLKEAVFNMIDKPVVAALLTGIVLIAFAFALRCFLRQTSATSIDSFLSLLWFFIALLPVANLFFYYIDTSENDRYGYFALPFFWIWLGFATKIFSVSVSRGLAVLSIVLSFVFLNTTTRYWMKLIRSIAPWFLISIGTMLMRCLFWLFRTIITAYICSESLVKKVVLKKLWNCTPANPSKAVWQMQ